MNRTVFTLTMRQIIGQKRVLLAGVVSALIPVGLAVIARAGDVEDPDEWTANTLIEAVLITLVVPLACLLVGNSAMGTEIEDGTAVYLLSKPLPRREIIFSKAAAAIVISAAFLLPVAIIAPALSLQGADGDGLILGSIVATVLGICAYTMLFVYLSVATSRSLLIGLAYIFIWEGVVGDLFTGTRYLSIRQYCLGIVEAVSGVSNRVFEAELNGAAGLVLITAVTGGATILATRALQRFEVRGED
jgi:ABC-2 type transport system permease protein